MARTQKDKKEEEGQDLKENVNWLSPRRWGWENYWRLASEGYGWAINCKNN